MRASSRQASLRDSADRCQTNATGRRERVYRAPLGEVLCSWTRRSRSVHTPLRICEIGEGAPLLSLTDFDQISPNFHFCA